MLVTGEIPHAVAAIDPVLMILAKAVAGTPTCTERLAGRTAERTAASARATAFATLEQALSLPPESTAVTATK